MLAGALTKSCPAPCAHPLFPYAGTRRIQPDAEYCLQWPHALTPFSPCPLFQKCLHALTIAFSGLRCPCFLCRHPYTRSLTLTNASKLPSKFEIVPQENQSKGLALIKVEPEAGGIPALGSQTVQVTLKTSRLGRIQLPLKLKVGTWM